MSEIILILIGTVLVNNFVLVRFLGLCPFMGVSRNLEAAAGMSLATAFVLTLSSAVAYPVAPVSAGYRCSSNSCEPSALSWLLPPACSSLK